jgi:hypothetical protein
MRNRRTEPRFFADQPVTVSVLGAAEAVSGAGRIVDFSASGIGIELEFDVPSGSRLKLQWPRGSVIAEVCYCRQKAPGNFRAGLKITEVVAIANIAEQSGVA